MKLSDFIDALKAFFFDILGYFIPGFYAILMLSLCITPDYKYRLDYMGLDKEWNGFIIFLLSYILGYCLYSLSDMSDILIFKLKFLKLKNPTQVESEIDSSQELMMSKIALTELLIKKDNSPAIDTSNLNAMKARNLRSIIMSYIPEADTKVYTFMFRSELCRIISSFSIFLSVLGLLFTVANVFIKSPLLFKNDSKTLIVYVLLLFSCYFLTKARIRFLSIAYKIPFAIFIAKYFKIKL